nr:hypothetical protein [Tanacetum cinerariifolium]
MSSIIAQQTKLDHELVPKENKLDIRKCNGRIPHGLKLREPTFQVILDAIALTPCYPAFLITTDVPEEINSLNDVVFDQMHQPWRTFDALINRGLSGKISGFDKLHLSRAQIFGRAQRKSFYAYAKGKQSRGYVYFTKRILAVTRVSIIRKHKYGYLEEIVVRRADNTLYKFKEGNFSRLQINDIEDMLLLVVQNWLINLSGDDVADFVIALRMFTRSLVIQNRVKDLQLRVKVIKSRSTSPNLILQDPISKKDTLTLHRRTLKDSYMSTTTRGTS